MVIKGIIIGFEALVSIFIITAALTLFLVNFCLMYSNASNSTQHLSANLIKEANLQHLFYISYHSHLSLNNFKRLLKAQNPSYSISNFYKHSVPQYPSRIIVIKGKTYLVMIK